MQNTEKEMSFWEHLEELRWMLFKIIIALIGTTICSFTFVDDILKMFLLPIGKVQASHPELVIRQILSSPIDSVIIKLKAAFLGGLIVGFPFMFYFIWKYIKPGLKENENKALVWICGTGTFSFAAGVVCGYLMIAPMLSMLLKFSIPTAENLWTIKEFVNFVFYWLIGAGIIFELPLIIIVLVKFGIIQITLLKRIRPYFMVGSLVVAALIAPSPDPFSMLLIGIPLIFLYELGIFFASFALRNRDDTPYDNK